ncbi:hypothetical protein [Paenibacillus sp. JJ-100]|nr:hypothetical protein [Paenibacillus sp. JJ-100]
MDKLCDQGGERHTGEGEEVEVMTNAHFDMMRAIARSANRADT